MLAIVAELPAKDPNATASSLSGEVTLLLHDALWRGGSAEDANQQARPANLELYLNCRSANWDEYVIGYSTFFATGDRKVKSYNAMDHEGRVASAA